MRIAVLSGKGGTGKTLVSVNLAAAAKESLYIDCDVEEPNGHLFFKPDNIREEEVSVRIPKVDNKLCNGCRRCVDFCRFNALAHIRDKLIIFEEICHSCGGCIMLCPEKALTEREKVIGKVQKGTSDKVNVHTGLLNTGEASGIPIIKKLLGGIGSEQGQDKPELGKPDLSKSDAVNTGQIKADSGKPDPYGPVFVDCPPGSACIVMESIKDADYCILVAEPTLFGVHNLNMVYELVNLFKKPLGVILNKCLDGENPSERFCIEKGIRIVGRIPYDEELGMLNSNAEIAVRVKERYKALFTGLLNTVKKEVQHEAASYPQR